MQLRTNYKIGEIPHSEHPCPQSMRKNWLCLNGEWAFCKQDAQGNTSYESKIIVPFSPETLNSGIEEGFVLQSGEKLVYNRTVVLDEAHIGGRIKLHFGGVDCDAEVLLNGETVGRHHGGYTAFSIDVTSKVKAGENSLTVICKDEGTRDGSSRGKQSDKRGGIWYTPHSGIWQTVWLEFMPLEHIGKFFIKPNATDKTVNIRVGNKEEIEIVVFDGGKEIIKERFIGEITLAYDFRLWSPEEPYLYDFVLRHSSGDEVYSYFGVRSFGKAKDKNGIARLTLNGKPYFFNGVLDQGYWSDGLLTYPSDEAAVDELTLLKEMGFNTVRKHIKIEPMRWYYHCDRLGLVVWQDFVNGGGEYKFTHIAAFPFLGFHHRDDDYAYFARENEGGRYAFMREAEETLDQLYNCVSIGVWVPFNEGWGQFDSAQVTEFVRQKDNTRIIDSVSGWHDQGVEKTELKSLHTYYTKLRVPKDPRPVVLSEFGGYSMKIDGHVFAEDKEFGYKKFKTEESLFQALEKLYLKKLAPLIKKGLCGCIYTQVSDVEEEINGFVTYDRKIVKVPPEKMRAINALLAKLASEIE